MEDLVKCFHCKQQVRVKVNKRFVQVSPIEFYQRLSSVTCQNCNEVLGFVDSFLETEVTILKMKIADLENTKKQSS